MDKEEILKRAIIAFENLLEQYCREYNETGHSYDFSPEDEDAVVSAKESLREVKKIVAAE